MFDTLKNMEALWAIAIICIGTSQALIGILLLLQNWQQSKTKELVMGLLDDLNAVKDQLDKAKGEIVEKLGQLQNALADAKSTTDPAVVASVAALKDAAQALDDVVPDAVAEAVADAAVEPVVADEDASASE